MVLRPPHSHGFFFHCNLVFQLLSCQIHSVDTHCRLPQPAHQPGPFSLLSAATPTGLTAKSVPFPLSTHSISLATLSATTPLCLHNQCVILTPGSFLQFTFLAGSPTFLMLFMQPLAHQSDLAILTDNAIPITNCHSSWVFSLVPIFYPCNIQRGMPLLLDLQLWRILPQPFLFQPCP